MDKSHLIAVDTICRCYEIEPGFLFQLAEYELIHLIRKDEVYYLEADELNLLERYIRLHYDLEINFEGLDVIRHLLEKIEAYQQRLQTLEWQLRVLKSQFE